MEVFSKILTSTDVTTTRLTVPTECLHTIHIPIGEHFVDLKVKAMNNMTKEVWIFRCYIRKEGHPKPIFSGDWRDFVEAKDLMIGDRVIFHQDYDEETDTEYKIEVNKALRLFGAIIRDA